MMKKLLCTLLLTAFAVGFVQAQSISVTGLGQPINDGDVTISVANDTDFDNVDVNDPSGDTHTFTISNNTASVLSLGLDNLSNQTDFSYTAPGSPNPLDIGPADTSQFSVTFTPQSVGSLQSVVTITVLNNDTFDEETFTFTVGGVGEDVPPPAEPIVRVFGGPGLDVEIFDGDAASVAQGTAFGDVVENTSAANTFRIFNDATATENLIISNAADTGSSDFVFSLVPFGSDITITPGNFIDVTVTYTPDAPGADSGNILFLHNDNTPSSLSPFSFNVSGNGIIAPPDEPEIDISYSGGNILTGGSVDFGSVNVSSGNSDITFTITNNGTQPLILDGTPIVDISGTNSDDFILFSLPTTPVAANGGITTFTIRFAPSDLGARDALLSIDNNDTDENPFIINLTGTGEDTNLGTPLLITQYYEGTGPNDKWVEIKNVSTSTVTNGSFYLALYTDLSTTLGTIEISRPNEFIAIPTIAPGEVLLFSNPNAALPLAGNLGQTAIPTNVCTFDGNDVILITTTFEALQSYNSRIDIVGVVGSTTPPFWGADTSFIKGCGTSESPSTIFDYTSGTNTVNDYIELTIEEVNAANTATNIALGTQTVGSTVYTSSWSNGIPDKTKDALISGTYNAGSGSFETCNLTVSGTLNMNGATTNFVKVNENLAITGSFTVGDTESLVTVNESASISGSITKLENSTALNNFRDFTYWSTPVQGANIGTVFSGVDPNRIFQWRNPSSGDVGAWEIASGTMTNARGYISEAPSGATQHNISFTGTPNNGIVSRTVGFDNTISGGVGFNLVGNPYPSAIDADQFILLSDNSEINNGTMDGTIWLWTHNTQISNGETGEFVVDDYVTYNLTGGVGDPSNIPSNNIGSGQGFFINTVTSGTIFFNNAMRLDDENDQFFRASPKTKSSNEEKDRLWLNIRSNEGGAFNQLLIGFFDKATDGFDRGFDGKKFNGGNYISFYSKIGDDRYAIQGFGPYSSDKQITLGLDTYIAQTFKISIHQVEGILQNEEIYLVDNELDIVHDLKASDYEFEITETGFYTDRFTLQFNKSVLSVGEENLDNNFLVINENSNLRLRSNSVISNVKVYDILGRELMNVQPKSTDYPLDTNNIARGTVLIINATLDNGAEVSKKVIKQ